MTDTYKMHTKTKKYAVRCYPNPRRWLAEVEYSYLIDFAKNYKMGQCRHNAHQLHLDKIEVSHIAHIQRDHISLNM